MADTVRSLAALQSLLADNTSGAISPQDVRDMLISLIPSRGELSLSSAATTTISTVNTPVKIAGTTTFSSDERDVDMPENNRLRYTGTVAKDFHVLVAFGGKSASSNQNFTVYVAKNGTVISKSGNKGFFSSVSFEEPAGFCQVFTELTNNDYVEAWIENNTGTANFDISSLNVSMQGVIK